MRHRLGTLGKVILVPPATDVLEFFRFVYVQETRWGQRASELGVQTSIDCQFMDVAPVVSADIGPEVRNIHIACNDEFCANKSPPTYGCVSPRKGDVGASGTRIQGVIFCVCFILIIVDNQGRRTGQEEGTGSGPVGWKNEGGPVFRHVGKGVGMYKARYRYLRKMPLGFLK